MVTQTTYDILKRTAMEKVERCPKCGEDSPALTLRCSDAFLQVEHEVPETREYELVCLHCGEIIQTISIDNTIKAMVKSRREMDKLYGKMVRIAPLLVDRRKNE